MGILSHFSACSNNQIASLHSRTKTNMTSFFNLITIIETKKESLNYTI